MVAGSVFTVVVAMGMMARWLDHNIIISTAALPDQKDFVSMQTEVKLK